MKSDISYQMISPELELEHDSGDETDVLVEREKYWTTKDKLLLVFGVVVNFGDGVEIYLPGSSNTILSRSVAR